MFRRIPAPKTPRAQYSHKANVELELHFFLTEFVKAPVHMAYLRSLDDLFAF